MHSSSLWEIHLSLHTKHRTSVTPDAKAHRDSRHPHQHQAPLQDRACTAITFARGGKFFDPTLKLGSAPRPWATATATAALHVGQTLGLGVVTTVSHDCSTAANQAAAYAHNFSAMWQRVEVGGDGGRRVCVCVCLCVCVCVCVFLLCLLWRARVHFYPGYSNYGFAIQQLTTV